MIAPFHADEFEMMLLYCTSSSQESTQYPQRTFLSQHATINIHFGCTLWVPHSHVANIQCHFSLSQIHQIRTLLLL